MFYFQRYPWNWTIPSFFWLKCQFLWVSPLLLLYTWNTQVSFTENSQMKINSLKKLKHWYLIHTWSDKAFKGTVVNRTIPSLHKGSFEITLIVCNTICIWSGYKANIFYQLLENQVKWVIYCSLEYFNHNLNLISVLIFHCFIGLTVILFWFVFHWFSKLIDLTELKKISLFP